MLRDRVDVAVRAFDEAIDIESRGACCLVYRRHNRFGSLRGMEGTAPHPSTLCVCHGGSLLAAGPDIIEKFDW